MMFPTRRWILACTLLILTGMLFAQPPEAGTPPTTATKESFDTATLSPLARAYYVTAWRSAEWLWQANRPDGTFVPGFNPAMNQPVADAGYLTQTAAAASLARSARVLNSPRLAVRARQTLLVLLASTKQDPQDPKQRFTMMPAATVNRTASAALLVQAIYELPDPTPDLVEQAEQLMGYLRTLQQPDGSFATGEAGDAMRNATYQAWSVAALAASHARQPHAWKTAALSAAFGYYRSRWQTQCPANTLPVLMEALVTTCLRTNDKTLAPMVLEMADFIMRLQFPENTAHPAWQGGFAGWRQGQVVAEEPTTESAHFVAALCQAVRIAKFAGDETRAERYRAAAERGLAFLISMHYTEANTKHFAEWYRGQVIGAFACAPGNGTVRLENCQAGVTAFARYVEDVLEIKPSRAQP
jgi:hypothetical protein